MSTGVPACMLCRMLSRAAPAASFSDAPNAVRTGTGSVTISGLNFGVYCFTPTGSLEDSSDHACTSTSWTSATSAACRVQASRGSPGRGIVRDAMTVVGVVGTRQMFTYDGTPLGQRASWQDAFDAAPKLRMCDRVAGCVEVVMCAEQARSRSDRTAILDGLFSRSLCRRMHLTAAWFEQALW